MNWLLAGNKTRPAYKTGIEILSSHGIALWDSVGSCVREGSLDSAIREIEPNPVDRILKENPGTAGYCFYQSAIDISSERGLEFRKAGVCLETGFP